MIILSGNKRIFTDDLSASYKVVKGSVQVFFAPSNEDGNMRHIMLLKDAKEGTIIPHLAASWGLGGKKTVFRLQIVGAPEAVIEKIPAKLEHDEEFLKTAEIPYYDQLSPDLLSDTLLNLYVTRTVSERKIVEDISNRRQKEKVQSIKTIQHSFEDKHLENFMKDAKTSSPLYNAVRVVCEMSDIPVSSLKDIKQVTGDDFNLADVARKSGFVCREVRLPDNWASEDINPFVVLFGEESQPLACYRRHGKIRYWNAETGEEGLLKKILKNLDESKVFIICKPLAAGKAKSKDVLKYCLSQFRVIDIATYIAAMFLSTYATLQLTILTERLYTQIIPHGNMTDIIGVALYILAFTLGGLLFSISKALVNFRISSRIKYPLYAACYDRLFHMQSSYFRNKSTADIAYRVEMMPDIYVNMLTSVIQMVSTIVFSTMYLTKMVKYSPVMTKYALIFVILTMVFSMLLGLASQKLVVKRSNLNTRVRGLLLQMFTGIETIRNYSSEEEFSVRFLDQYSEYSKILMRSDGLQRLQTFIISGTGFGALLIFYILMGKGMLGISTGIFLAFITAYTAYSASMTSVAGNILLLLILRPILKTTSDIFDEIPETAATGVMPSELTGTIDISNVSFAYPNSNSMVLNDINIKINPGEYVAIVGPSGCGKSTLLKLLLGLEKTTRGKIYYDGIDIDRINKIELRRRIGTVLQDGALFSGSIYKNISIAHPDIDEQAVLDAVEIADLTETMAKMPLGLSTPVSEESGSISGGQKQRIMIARAVVSKPKILFMDEATSALDNITQARVQKNLDSFNATRVLIAHRLSTIINCDCIYVMNKGQIVESGTYEELMENKKMFYSLVQKQML